MFFTSVLVNKLSYRASHQESKSERYIHFIANFMTKTSAYGIHIFSLLLSEKQMIIFHYFVLDKNVREAGVP